MTCSRIAPASVLATDEHAGASTDRVVSVLDGDDGPALVDANEVHVLLDRAGVSGAVVVDVEYLAGLRAAEGDCSVGCGGEFPLLGAAAIAGVLDDGGGVGGVAVAQVQALAGVAVLQGVLVVAEAGHVPDLFGCAGRAVPQFGAAQVGEGVLVHARDLDASS